MLKQACRTPGPTTDSTSGLPATSPKPGFYMTPVKGHLLQDLWYDVAVTKVWKKNTSLVRYSPAVYEISVSFLPQFILLMAVTVITGNPSPAVILSYSPLNCAHTYTF